MPYLTRKNLKLQLSPGLVASLRHPARKRSPLASKATRNGMCAKPMTKLCGSPYHPLHVGLLDRSRQGVDTELWRKQFVAGDYTTVAVRRSRCELTYVHDNNYKVDTRSYHATVPMPGPEVPRWTPTCSALVEVHPSPPPLFHILDWKGQPNQTITVL